MTTKLPYGAQAILNLRLQGLRPADMVLVSFVGPLHGEAHPVVIGRLGREYDWRFLADLDCLVVVDSSQPDEVVRATMKTLQAQPINYLGLWISDRQQGTNYIVGGVIARPHGVLRYMDAETQESFAGLGLRKRHLVCA